MAGGDLSGCIEFSASYVGYYRFNSGRIGVSFDCTGDEVKAIIGKDPTVDLTAQAFYLEQLKMNCGSCQANLYDGSGGQFLVGIGSDNTAALGGSIDCAWNQDPLVCLTAESTQGICLSSDDGRVSGFIKGYWGPAPK